MLLIYSIKEQSSPCFIIPYKSLVTPMQVPLSPNHRNGLTTDLKRTQSEGITEVNIRHKGIVMSRLHFAFKKKNFHKIRHSSPSALQHFNTQYITRVIQPLSLVTQLITQTQNIPLIINKLRINFGLYHSSPIFPGGKW